MTDVNSTCTFLPRLPDEILRSQPFEHRLCLIALKYAWDMYESCGDWNETCLQVSSELFLSPRESAWLQDFADDGVLRGSDPVRIQVRTNEQTNERT